MAEPFMNVTPVKSISLVVFLLGVMLLAFQIFQITTQPLAQEVKLPELINPANVPVYNNANASDSYEQLGSQVTATSVFAMDLNSASQLFAKNEQLPVYPASTTKMMTALLARQLYPLDEWITISPQASAAEGNTVGWYTGEKITVNDLLKGLLIFSGNDAAEALAEHHPQGRQGFIQDMNRLATQLHLENTTFTNPSGLDDASQQTTARDLTLLAKEVVADDVLRSIVSSQTDTVVTQQGRISTLYSTNQLLRFTEYQGVKTGTTPEAGEVLISKVSIHDQPVLITLLKSQDRYKDMQAIVDWIDQQYSWTQIPNLLAE